MWTPLAQRNALRALFMSPSDANILAERAQRVATANSAYRNLLYIANRDSRQLARDKAALASADALSAEYHTLRNAIAAHTERLDDLYDRRREADEARTEARSTLEGAKFNYDDLLREVEALKLARVANAFPSATEAGDTLLPGSLAIRSAWYADRAEVRWSINGSQLSRTRIALYAALRRRNKRPLCLPWQSIRRGSRGQGSVWCWRARR